MQTGHAPIAPLVLRGRAGDELSAEAPAEQHIISVQLGAYDADVRLDGKLLHSGRGGPGACQIARPGGRASVTMRADWVMLQLQVPQKWLVDVLAREGIPVEGFELVDPRCRHAPGLLGVATAFAREVHGDGLVPGRLDALATELSVQLLRTHSNRRRHGGADGRERLAPWQVQRALARLADGFDADVRLAEIASECGLSPFHFARAFRRTVGEPPYRSQLRLRMGRAKDLLRSSACEVGDVAMAVGYQSSQAFARAFRRETGQSPMEFRRGWKGGETD